MNRLIFFYFKRFYCCCAVVLLCCFSAWRCGGKSKFGGNRNQTAIPKLSFEVVNRYHHNTSNFTEGLLVYDDLIFESTGQKGESRIISYTIPFISEKEMVKLSEDFFGEGISILNNKLYQLTWQDHKLFVYDYPSMKLQTTINVDFEGWGMTTSAKALIISDGSSVVRWVEPNTFSEIKRINVSDEYGNVDYINELELIHGFLYANRWQTNTIYKIDTATGKIVASLDMSLLMENAKSVYHQADVANGIAFRPEKNTLLLTGKNWPFIYEVKITSQP